MYKETLFGILGLFVLLFSLSYCDAHAQEALQFEDASKPIKCHNMTTQFQKLLSEKYDIQAAGIGVDINGFPLKNAKVISMVLISKDKSEMAIVDLIDSNLMCLISLSKEPRYVNAGESKGGWEEIKAN